MYDELIKALRETDFSDGCPCNAEPMCENEDCVIAQAADAIEYLMRKLESRESALNSVVECLDNSAVAATDVLDTGEDRIG